MEISEDGSMVAGGFSDSSVRLWDLKKSAKDKEKVGSVYLLHKMGYNANSQTKVLPKTKVTRRIRL